jgi:hypothetical protein
VESERPYRVLVRVFKPNTVERVYDRTVAPRDGRLKISLDETLEHIRREALLVTGAVQPGSFPEVFEKLYTEQEEESRFIPYGETVSFYWGNWGTAPMGGMDKGMDGDGHGLLATKWYEEPIFPIELQRDYSGGPAEMIIEVDGWPPGKADLFWDGEVLARGISTKRGKKPFDVPAGVDLSPGEHRFKIVMQDGRVFRVDTLTIRQKR